MKITREYLIALSNAKDMKIPDADIDAVMQTLTNVEGDLIFLAIAGSRAYGTHIEGKSDFDFRGVFISPTAKVLRANPTTDGSYPYTPQVGNSSNDIVLYEVGRFIELLEKGNPNLLELLNVPNHCIVYESPLFSKYFEDKSLYLSKQLRHTFIGYTRSQIKKAKGMNKKIHNPQPKKRKDLLDFCYLIRGSQAINIKTHYPIEKGWYDDCGVVKIPHGKGMYSVFFDIDGKYNFRGMVKRKEGEESNEIRLSSIPKEALFHIPAIPFYFDMDGYQTHCKQHREYWKWVESRNPHRYKENIKSNLGYDLKNMMHCVRLIEVAEDIIQKGEIVVQRPNRDALLKIRNGNVAYTDLLRYVEEKTIKLDALFDASPLQEQVNKGATRDLLQKIRLENL